MFTIIYTRDGKRITYTMPREHMAAVMAAAWDYLADGSITEFTVKGE
jgi:hypothetical protein